MAMMAGILSGCGGSIGKSSEPVTLTVWTYYNGEQLDAFNALVDSFNDTVGKEKGIVVESSSQGSVNDLETNVMAAAEEKVGASDMPAIFSAYADTAYKLDEMGKVVDLSEYLTEDEQTDEPNDGKALFGCGAMANYMLVGAKQLGGSLFEVKDGKMGLNFDKDIVRKLMTDSFMYIILLVFHIITIQHEIWKNNRRNITYMKATGIVRRIDDLGRVVIPKEIRRTLRIKEGTPLEIFTDREGEVILKKYSPIGELSIFAKEYVEALAQTTGMTACITDHDQVVAASGHGSREYEGKGISRELDRVIAEREMKCYYGEEKGKIALVENQKENKAGLIIQPIICAGDAIGSVALVGKSNGERPGNSEKMLVQTAAGFLGRQMEQ